jgi:hypothetical protein
VRRVLPIEVQAYFAGLTFCLVFNNAHRFRAASPIRLRPAALIFRLGFSGSALLLLTAAHLFFCAAAIFLRAARVMVRLFGDVLQMVE